MRIWLVYMLRELQIKEFSSVYCALKYVKDEGIVDFAIINGQYIESSLK